MLVDSLLHAPATPEIYTLSLHDALPIFELNRVLTHPIAIRILRGDLLFQLLVADDAAFLEINEKHAARLQSAYRDRKSTRLNSSHVEISYAVFCLKKKKRGEQ